MSRSLLIFLWIFSIFLIINAKRPNKYEEDFEFIDEDDKNYQPQQKFPISSEKKKWIHDPSNDLCKPLNCKKKELCLLEDAFTAVCVSKKEFYKNRGEVISKYEFLEKEAKLKAKTVEVTKKNTTQKDLTTTTSSAGDDSDESDIFYYSDLEQKEKNCERCVDIKSVSFLCGSDNKTYSSLCRMEYHNCIKGTSVKVLCNGFCPCINDFGLTTRGMRNKNKYQKAKENGEKKKQNIEREFKFSPEDIKFNNKHYKYIRFFSENSREEKHASPKDNNKNNLKIECKQQELNDIGNRLLDWFSVIMADSKSKKKHQYVLQDRSLKTCKSEAIWMFNHLDANDDKYLTYKELFNLEHDQNEMCIKPFIDACDIDQNGILEIREWCNCFENTDRPCTALRRRINRELSTNSYVPDCDNEGFYKPTQCHKAAGVCWCCDKHGVEFANTRSRNSKPNNCEKLLSNASTIISDDEDDDIEGSTEN